MTSFQAEITLQPGQETSTTVESWHEEAANKLDNVGPVFIVGCPRSGTTFLVDCISRLSAVEAFSGVLVSERLMHLLGSGSLSDENQEHVLWAIRHTLWTAFIRRRESRGDALLGAFRGNRPWMDLLRRRKQLAKDFILVYKEPFASFALLPLATHFSSSKFIHIVRDGRDCADSLCRAYPYALSDDVLSQEQLWRQGGGEIGIAREWKNWSIPWWLPKGEEEAFLNLTKFGRCVRIWKEMVTRGWNLRAVVGEKRYLEIRYERLCSDPETVGQEIVSFLGTRSSASFERNLKKASKESIGVHKRNQPDGIMKEANEVGTPVLQELGYL